MANRFDLRVLTKGPLADAIPWPGPSVTSITQPIDLGPFEDAAPALLLFLRQHGLLGGTSGAGKGGGVNVLTGNLVACTDVVIWAIDLKRGMELQAKARAINARLLETETVGQDIEHIGSAYKRAELEALEVASWERRSAARS